MPLRFFELAFSTDAGLDHRLCRPGLSPSGRHQRNDHEGARPERELESFARTVEEAHRRESSCSPRSMTTTRFMLTPALMEFYAFLDAYQVDDAGNVTDAFKVAHPNVTLYAEAAEEPDPHRPDTLNPSSPNYMHWYDPDVGQSRHHPGGGMRRGPRHVQVQRRSPPPAPLGRARRAGGDAAGVTSADTGGSALGPQLTTADFTSWKMVTIRPPAANEGDDQLLRSRDVAVDDRARSQAAARRLLHDPRFLRELADQHEQPDARDDEPRRSSSPRAPRSTGRTAPAAAFDPGTRLRVHAVPGGPCFQCHQLLDPTRSDHSRRRTPGTITRRSTGRSRANRASLRSRAS